MIQEKYFNKERLILAMMRRGLSCHGLAKLTKINPSKLQTENAALKKELGI